MIASADSESRKKGLSPTGYILILDDHTLTIVNSVVQYKDLIEQKIIGIEKVELKRKAFSKMHAIYFLEPNEITLQKVNEDVKAKLYDSIHLYYTRAAPSAVFETLKGMPEVITKLISFKELNLDFLVVDDCTFTFKMDKTFSQLYNLEDAKLIETAAQKLYTLVSIFLPTCSLEVYTEKNSMSSQLGRKIMDIFKNTMAKHKEIFSESAKGIKLLVLDRAFDAKVAALHDFYYEPLVMDLSRIKNHSEEFETESAGGEKIKRTCTLDETDELWMKYRFKHIAEVMSTHSKR